MARALCFGVQPYLKIELPALSVALFDFFNQANESLPAQYLDSGQAQLPPGPRAPGSLSSMFQ